MSIMNLPMTRLPLLDPVDLLDLLDLLNMLGTLDLLDTNPEIRHYQPRFPEQNFSSLEFLH
jgi:hypothetical protein